MTLEALRRPPHFVPTLTDVVQAAPPVLSTPVPTASVPEDDARQRLVDAVSDRVLATLQPRLQQAVAEAMQHWMVQQVPVLAERVAQSLLDEVAEACRQTAEDMVSALAPVQPGRPADPLDL